LGLKNEEFKRHDDVLKQWEDNIKIGKTVSKVREKKGFCFEENMTHNARCSAMQHSSSRTLHLCNFISFLSLRSLDQLPNRRLLGI
jgi:hypothetical protein